ncbi:MAG: DUF6580 family putative transport protein [Sphingobacteriaceae bacterium]
MSLEKVNIRNGVLLMMVIVAAATRLIHWENMGAWANVTPVGAIALFGGAYFKDKVKAYAVPLLTLLISDVILNYLYYSKFVLFYEGAGYTYLAFAAMVTIGVYMKKVNVQNVLLASLAAVLMHWLITDIQPWLSAYPHTLMGYVQCLVAAIPFEKNLLIGNLVFSALLFGGFELAKSKYAVLRSPQNLAY